MTHQNLAGNVSGEVPEYIRPDDKASDLSSLQQFRVVVLKLGGSLLDLPDLANRLNQLLNDPGQCCSGFTPSPDTRWLIIPGGGTAADKIRQLDGHYHLPSSMTHWDAIAAMTFNAGMLARLIPAIMLVRSTPEAIAVWTAQRPAILDALHFLKNEGRSIGGELAESWQVTSDTIAATVCKSLHGACLILAKSLDLPAASTNWTDAAQLGLVDPSFPAAVENLNVHWVNLRRCAL